MNKLLKNILLVFVVCSLALTGCDDMFNKGDVEKAYDGPDVVGFKPLNPQVSVVVQEDGTHSEVVSEVEVQLISSEGLASSDVSVSYTLETDAPASLYNVSASSVTIASGTTSSSFTVTIPESADIDVGDEFILVFNIESVNGAEAEETLDQCTMIITGVEPAED